MGYEQPTGAFCMRWKRWPLEAGKGVRVWLALWWWIANAEPTSLANPISLSNHLLAHLQPDSACRRSMARHANRTQTAMVSLGVPVVRTVDIALRKKGQRLRTTTTATRTFQIHSRRL